MALAYHRRSSLLPRPAFTLIELLVTLTIITMVAGLSLAGLASSRQRAKIDKTKSTIRKLHEIVMPQYESYLTRRVAGSNAAARLSALRLLMVQEMPDQWAEVYAVGSLPTNAGAPPRRYADYMSSLASGPKWTANKVAYQGAECLAMLITRGGFAPDAVELFRNDEMGDIDGDGAPEFWDGWGNPIGFIRWPAGFASPVQVLNATTNPDPYDPTGVSGDYGLVPLIYSSGPNGANDDRLSVASGYAIGVAGLPPQSLATTRLLNPLGDLAGTITNSGAASDNITNHDLMTK